MKVHCLAGVVFVLSVGCATTKEAEKEPKGSGTSSGVASGNDAQLDAMRSMMAVQAARVMAETKCAPLEKREIPWDEERLVGSFFATSRLTQNKLYDADGKAGITTRVATVGKVLARKSARPDLPWTFGVIENDTPNAFHAPGGYVFVTTGLLARITNEAELAGVLAREIAHVAAKYPLNAYRRATHLQCVAATTIAEAARVGIAPGPGQSELIRFAQAFSPFDLERADGSFMKFLMDAVMQVQMLGIDRSQADDADRLGEELTAFSGYDASQFDAFLAKLDADPATKSSAWLSNKPNVADRLAKLKTLRESELAAFAEGKAKADLTGLFAPLKK